MPNLYNVPLENGVQLTTQNALLNGETTTITFTGSVTSKLQASASIPGILVIDRVDANGNETPTKTEYISFTGVTGSTVTGLVRGLANTTDQDHAAGAIVEFVPDVIWADSLNDTILVGHNADGTHKTLSLISLVSVTINNSVVNNPLITGGSLASLSLSNVAISGSLSSVTIVTSNIDTFSFKNINAPEGYLINGKIVPSVASDNLTVALKTLAGNDATASDPIYIRIGDNVRTITGALSNTLNAGTNWFNSGASELATQEVDYFVYLGDSAGTVRLGFGKIPYANVFEDYSATTTNDYHINFNSALTAGQSCTVIGRFAATLSGGAGYTWSVPTFTSTNLIQRPIRQTRNLTWTPVFTGSGSMTYTSVSVGTAKYVLNERHMTLSLLTRGTVGGTGSSELYATLPFLINIGASSGFPTNILRTAAYFSDAGGNLQAGVVQLESTNRKLAFYRTNAANWPLGGNSDVGCNLTLPLV